MPVTLGDRVLHGMHPTSTDLKYSIANTNMKGQISVSMNSNNQVHHNSGGAGLDATSGDAEGSNSGGPRVKCNDAGVMIFDKDKVYKLLI